MSAIENDDQYDSAHELTVEVIKARAAKGIVSLTGRTFLLQIISLLATILLTLFLEPYQYGVYFVVSAVINFFAFFSDIGFAAALIQKKENLTLEDMRTVFTAQQVLVGILLLVLFASTPILSSVYHMNTEAIYLLWALALSLFFSSLKTIPSVILERKLDFNSLVVPQIIETLLFNIFAVLLAWKGFGVTSFTIAVLVRGFSGLVLMYLIQPWKIGFSFSRDSFKSLFKYGLPYQLNNFLALLKDDGMTVILGVVLHASGVGLLGWAQKWAAAPLRFFMDQVIRVTFPAFARLQDDRKILTQAVSKSIFYICLIVFPSLVLLIIFAPILTVIVPKYGRWQPALIALYILSINTAWAAVSTPLTNMFNSIGKILTTFKLMIMWTVLTWIFLPLLSYLYGVNGAAAGFAIVGSSSFVVLIVSKKYIDVDFLSVVGKPLIAASLMAISLLIIRGFLPASFISIIVLGIAGATIYITLLILLIGKQFLFDIKDLLQTVRTRQIK